MHKTFLGQFGSPDHYQYLVESGHSVAYTVRHFFRAGINHWTWSCNCPHFTDSLAPLMDRHPGGPVLTCQHIDFVRFTSPRYKEYFTGTNMPTQPGKEMARAAKNVLLAYGRSLHSRDVRNSTALATALAALEE